MGADMDKFLHVGYPTKAFVLHSLLHERKLQSTTCTLSLSMTSTLMDSECEVPEPSLALQNTIITGLAQARY